jgi:hypothetical protein
MIQANELRIGNYVYLKEWNKVVQVSLLTRFSIDVTLQAPTSTDLEDYEPILLTEEWLFKFGFEKTPFGYYKLGSFYIDLHSNTYRLNREWVNINFQYIHSFQNLYFALTNQELNIKEL